MLGINTIIGLLFQSSVEEMEVEVLEIGSLVWVETLCYGLQLGEVKAIVANPFYGQTGMAAFVCGNGWTEYLPVDVEVK